MLGTTCDELALLTLSWCDTSSLVRIESSSNTLRTLLSTDEARLHVWSRLSDALAADTLTSESTESARRKAKARAADPRGDCRSRLVALRARRRRSVPARGAPSRWRQSHAVAVGGIASCPMLAQHVGVELPKGAVPVRPAAPPRPPERSSAGPRHAALKAFANSGGEPPRRAHPGCALAAGLRSRLSYGLIRDTPGGPFAAALSI